MNVRIFWVRVMKCMCAQTRPRFILSSERVFGGMEFEPMLTPGEKSPLPENFPRGGSNPRHCGQRAQTLPTSYSGPGYGFEPRHNSFQAVSVAAVLTSPHLFSRHKIPFFLCRMCCFYYRNVFMVAIEAVYCCSGGNYTHMHTHACTHTAHTHACQHSASWQDLKGQTADSSSMLQPLFTPSTVLSQNFGGRYLFSLCIYSFQLALSDCDKDDKNTMDRAFSNLQLTQHALNWLQCIWLCWNWLTWETHCAAQRYIGWKSMIDYFVI